ncbi:MULTISPECIES: hypothetical protein [Lactococcus]|uniref:hypothetical protein n=1 Tax=Lactococcus TaxID=1357 RepID=UPI0007AEE3A7|nr:MULTISPECIES: hypothetical protein [Lactococcus]KZK09952.1 hypothetical protein V4_0827 [Lactococcus cremoris]MDU8931470.1 hypothetical protein [Lactococcus cremoris]UBU73267.1 hypothetical protein I6G24_12625 [Lactococcus lactis]
MIKPIIDSQQTIGTTLVLLGVTERKEVIKKEDGTFDKTDNILGYNYEVVCLERKFEKVIVKTEEKRPLFEPDEEIPDDTLVAFENLSITPWVKEGWIQLSVKATKCIIYEEQG